MKTIAVFPMILAAVLLTPMSLRAQEDGHAEKCACMKGDEAKEAEEPAKKMECECACMKGDDAEKAGENTKKGMERELGARMKAETAEFDKLLGEMNASTGEEKVAVMAAIISKMAQKHREMYAKTGGTAQSNAESVAEVDYYTCKMHPSIHWPVPAKCPICSMDLKAVFKIGAAANSAVEPDEEIKKAEDAQSEHKH